MSGLFRLIISLWFINNADCAKILGVFPMPAKSHLILGTSLMKGLAERGHDVTIITPFVEKSPPKNSKYRQIIVGNIFQTGNTPNLFEMEGMHPLIYALAMNSIGNRLTESTFNDSNVQKLIKSKETFDVVIVEQFVNDAHKIFAHIFNAHLILFGTFGTSSWLNPLVANPAPPSYVPELMINFRHQNFCDRVKNFLVYILNGLNRHFLFFPAQETLLKKYFPNSPSLEDLNHNASIILVNSHVSTNSPVPRVPSIIDIGGFHVAPTKGQLPKDLKDFLDDAPNGVVYFSMGSALQSTNFPEEKRDSLLKTFAKLPQKILWKWEGDELPGKPKNVKVSKWLPQPDVLAHPNVKLFITHGGLLSLIESVYHGVAVLAIPVFGDQQLNAKEIVASGFGLAIPYRELNQEQLDSSIKELLTNPKYDDNIKRRSRIMHDRQVKPMDNANYWVEYVVRHNGARHLRVPGLDLAWYQYSSLDVVAFLLSSILLTSILFFIVIRRCLRPRNVSKLKKN